MARKRVRGTGDDAGESVSAAWARVRIAKIFRDLREASGHTQAEVAKYLFRHVGSYGNIERADPRVAFRLDRDIQRMVEFCGASQEILDLLLELADTTNEEGPFTRYREVMSAEFGMYADMMRNAESIHNYEPELVPGLFQTKAYATQVMSLPGTDGRKRDPEAVATRVELRLRRQELLTRAKPLRVGAIVGEAALRSRVGGPELMADQLEHLVRLAKRRNVTIRVVPLWTGLHLGMTTGSFCVMRFPDNTTTPIVYSDGFMGDSYFKKPGEVALYDAAFADIVRHALNITESRALMHDIAKELSAHD